MAIIGWVIFLLLIYIVFFDGFSASGPVVEFHYTDWCGYCKKMKPIWYSIKGDIPGVKFVEIDEDKAKTPGITGYPTILLKHNGQTKTFNNVYDSSALKNWIMGSF